MRYLNTVTEDQNVFGKHTTLLRYSSPSSPSSQSSSDKFALPTEEVTTDSTTKTRVDLRVPVL